ncbi:hypothetical protein GCM10023156_05550 [Novipirellula rosea]|uniref:Secreted protein n=1 Tax=Novipirellula rosea TaxID=1031540 RepID=A0ABP8MB27_9BACT
MVIALFSPLCLCDFLGKLELSQKPPSNAEYAHYHEYDHKYGWFHQSCKDDTRNWPKYPRRNSENRQGCVDTEPPQT